MNGLLCNSFTVSNFLKDIFICFTSTKGYAIGHFYMFYLVELCYNISIIFLILRFYPLFSSSHLVLVSLSSTSFFLPRSIQQAVRPAVGTSARAAEALSAREPGRQVARCSFMCWSGQQRIGETVADRRRAWDLQLRRDPRSNHAPTRPIQGWVEASAMGREARVPGSKRLCSSS